MILYQDLVSLARWLVEGEHEEMEVDGEAVHDGDLVPAPGPHKPSRHPLAGLIGQGCGHAAIKVHEGRLAAPGSQLLRHVEVSQLRLEAQAVATHVNTWGLRVALEVI